MECEQSFDHAPHKKYEEFVVISIAHEGLTDNCHYLSAVKNTKFSYKFCLHCCKKVRK